LIGNASCQTARLRRKKILVDQNPDLQDLADKDASFRGAAPLLFGEGQARPKSIQRA